MLCQSKLAWEAVQYKRGNTKGLHKHSTQATTFVNLYSSLRGTKTLMLTTFLCPTASLLSDDPTGHPRKDLELIVRHLIPQWQVLGNRVDRPHTTSLPGNFRDYNLHIKTNTMPEERPQMS